ncbi:TraX family protein [Pseudoflavonifractor sp. MSJ-37]|uniref:TraX family protein n=1 Tax=Pseudoflavonifractor sp. MSJ-37 TaxID=2841531 RepID=UPI001C10CEC0|nr:TraX family protein [Pseudoflavonifractor sp. MSJ-37]MBU5434738.1 conjugal transfer protein TraX [Pseudoflavonifractor sp. MSJ-37]
MSTGEPAQTHTGGLTGTQLKYLAAFFMVIDHIGMLFHPMASFLPPEDLRYDLFRYLGRLAFPIFAFFVAEGCRKTRCWSSYVKRLFFFTLLTQIPLYIVMPRDGFSIMTTFFLAVLAIGCIRILRAKGHPAAAFLAGAACIILAQLLHGDYGWVGALTVVSLYLCGEDRSRQFRVLAACLCLYYLGGVIWDWWLSSALELLAVGSFGAIWSTLNGRMSSFCSFALPHAMLMAICSCAALIPLSRYDGRRGNGSRWFFYWFYPLHLLFLYGASLLLARS